MKAVPIQISSADLRALIGGSQPFALLDVREEADFAAEGHLFLATPAPASRIECVVQRLVPWRGTPIVLSDAGNGLIEDAAARVTDLGYTDIRLLDESPRQWEKNGFVPFHGINVPSKAFGEYVQAHDGTLDVSPEQLAREMEKGNALILDCRPPDEYARATIPGAINCPGSELAYRASELAPDPSTRIIVNCAGRTRSILGAQSLIAASVPNRIDALRGGLMAWRLAGFEPETGRRGYAASDQPKNLENLRSLSRQLAESAGVRTISLWEFDRLKEDDARPLYVFDVRPPNEYDRGHLPEARNVIGVQLIQRADTHMGTYRATVALVDDTGARAWMTGYWLARMGLWYVVVLDDPLAHGRWVRGSEVRNLIPPARLRDRKPASSIGAEKLAKMLATGAVRLIDLARSSTYKAGHIPGAAYAAPDRLEKHLGEGQQTMLTSPNGYQAMLAAMDLPPDLSGCVSCLENGTLGWRESGRPLTEGDCIFLDEPRDAYVRPYELESGQDAAMRAYLAWEQELPRLLESDGSATFLSP